MDERSDVDEMVVFSDGSVTPQTYLSRLKAFVERCYGSSEIDQSSPRSVLELNDITFDVVPVIKIGFGETRFPMARVVG